VYTHCTLCKNSVILPLSPIGTTWTGGLKCSGGKNWILRKEINANRFFWDSHWLEIWKNNLYPSMVSNGGSVAMDSDWEIELLDSKTIPLVILVETLYTHYPLSSRYEQNSVLNWACLSIFFFLCSFFNDFKLLPARKLSHMCLKKEEKNYINSKSNCEE
jgi:hypothetical protein